MRWTFLLVAAAALSAADLGAQLRLELNIPEQTLHLYRADARIRSYPVSVGEPGFDTPHGDFEIRSAEWNPSWRPPASEWARDRQFTPPGPQNPMGRVKLFFMPLYFLHGTSEEDKIGTPASHGCVRLRNRDIIELARILHEEGAPQVSSAEIDGILARPTQTRAVRFRSGVPLVIRYDRYRIRGDSVQVYPDLYRRGGLHAEGVRQALLAAGHPIHHASSAEIARFVAAVDVASRPGTLALRDFFPLLGVPPMAAGLAGPGRPRPPVELARTVPVAPPGPSAPPGQP